MDSDGLPLAVAVTTANLHDSKGAYPLIANLSAQYKSIKTIKADNGYKGKLTEIVNEILSLDMQCVKSNYDTVEFIPLEGGGLWSGPFHGLTISDVCAVIMSNCFPQPHLW